MYHFGNGISNSVFVNFSNYNMSRSTTKPTIWLVRLAKTQISLGIRLAWSEPSLCAQWVAKDPRFLHADREDWSAQSDLSLQVFVLIVHLFVSYAQVNLCHFFSSSWCRVLAAASASDSSWTFLFTFSLGAHVILLGLSCCGSYRVTLTTSQTIVATTSCQSNDRRLVEVNHYL